MRLGLHSGVLSTHLRFASPASVRELPCNQKVSACVDNSRPRDSQPESCNAKHSRLAGGTWGTLRLGQLCSCPKPIVLGFVDPGLCARHPCFGTFDELETCIQTFIQWSDTGLLLCLLQKHHPLFFFIPSTNVVHHCHSEGENCFRLSFASVVHEHLSKFRQYAFSRMQWTRRSAKFFQFLWNLRTLAPPWSPPQTSQGSAQSFFFMKCTATERPGQVPEQYRNTHHYLGFRLHLWPTQRAQGKGCLTPNERSGCLNTYNCDCGHLLFFTSIFDRQ